jgi:hypothetical protein
MPRERHINKYVYYKVGGGKLRYGGCITCYRKKKNGKSKKAVSKAAETAKRKAKKTKKGKKKVVSPADVYAYIKSMMYA